MQLSDVLARLANHIDDAIIVTDAECLDEPGPRIVYANQALYRQMGFSAEEVIGRSPRIFQGTDTSQETRAQIREAMRRGEPVNVEILNYTRDGQERWCDISIVPLLDEDEKVRFFAAIQRDTTERRQREQDLDRAKQQAEAASRAKGNFLAHMSHELRTPLNAILGFSEIINQEIFGPVGNNRYLSYAGDIHLSATHLLEIVNDVLDMSRIEAGRIDMAESEFELLDLLDDARRIVGSHAETGQVELVVECQAAFRLYGDRRLLKQCLVNLLSNAVKFTAAGGRVIITALLLADGQFALIVNDTGVGIPSDKVLEAMEPYVTVDRRNGQATRQGAGLGLPITKAFVELHGGALFINSEIGAGTSVFVTLPASRLTSHNAADAEEEAWGKLCSAPCPSRLVEGISHMTPAEIDRLPIGVLKLDADGTILSYSDTESRFSGVLRDEALGRNFFTDIAPCTSVSQFRERFSAGVRDGTLNEVMSYVFRFPKRQMRVMLDMRAAREPGQGWVFVRWF